MIIAVISVRIAVLPFCRGSDAVRQAQAYPDKALLFIPDKHI